jgi:hypothetical protein
MPAPFFAGQRYEDWVLDDPAGQDIETVRPPPRHPAALVIGSLCGQDRQQ